MRYIFMLMIVMTMIINSYAQTTINVFSPTDKVDYVKINANFANLRQSVDSTWNGTTNPLSRNFNIWSNSLTNANNIVGIGSGIVTGFQEMYVSTIKVSTITAGTGSVDSASVSNWNKAYAADSFSTNQLWVSPNGLETATGLSPWYPLASLSNAITKINSCSGRWDIIMAPYSYTQDGSVAIDNTNIILNIYGNGSLVTVTSANGLPMNKGIISIHDLHIVSQSGYGISGSLTNTMRGYLYSGSASGSTYDLGISKGIFYVSDSFEFDSTNEVGGSIQQMPSRKYVTALANLNMGAYSITNLGEGITFSGSEFYISDWNNNNAITLGTNYLSFDGDDFSFSLIPNIAIMGCTNFQAKYIIPASSNDVWTLGKTELPWADLLYGNSISLTTKLNQVDINIASASNRINVYDASSNNLVYKNTDATMTGYLRGNRAVVTNNYVTLADLNSAIGGLSVLYASTNTTLSNGYYDARTFLPTHTQSVISASSVTSGQYLAQWISNTNLITEIRQGIAVINSRMRISTTTGGRALTVKPEIYLHYVNETEPELFEVSQTIPLTATFADYMTTIDCSTNVTVPNDARVVVKWKAVTAANAPTWEFICGTGLVIACRLPVANPLSVRSQYALYSDVAGIASNVTSVQSNYFRNYSNITNTIDMTNYFRNGVNITNTSFAFSMSYGIASNDTNQIIWSPVMTKPTTLTNLTMESSVGLNWSAICVRTNNGLANYAWHYLAYTNIPVVGGTSSNLAYTINLNQNTLFGFLITNGVGSNVTMHISGVR